MFKLKIKQFLLVLIVGILVITFFVPFVKGKNNFDNSKYELEPIILSYDFGSKIKNENNFKSKNNDLSKTILEANNFQRPQSLYVYTGDPATPSLYDITEKQDNAINNHWYGKTIHALSINFLDYAFSKNDFLNKYKYVTTNILLADNFWNSWENWTYSNGVQSDFYYRSLKFTLSGKTWEPGDPWFDERSHQVWTNTDGTHNYNERTSVRIIEEWIGNILNLYIKLDAMVKWKGGSNVHHEAIIRIAKPEFNFRQTSNFIPFIPKEISNDNNLNYDGHFGGFSANINANFMGTIPPTLLKTENKVSIIGLFDLSKILVANKHKRKSVFALESFFIFTTKVRIGSYIQTIILYVNFSANTLFGMDSTFVLNSPKLVSTLFKGKMLFVLTNEYSYIKYLNRFGVSEMSNYIVPPSGSLPAYLLMPLIWAGISTTTYYYELEK